LIATWPTAFIFIVFVPAVPLAEVAVVTTRAVM
jgi:hypothetical protein